MFFKKVLELVRGVPYGRVTTYGEIAQAVGSPKASRAVGNVLHMNHDPQIPCHRVVKGNGELGGYNRGIDKKIALLRREGVLVKDGIIQNFKEVLFRFPNS